MLGLEDNEVCMVLAFIIPTLHQPITLARGGSSGETRSVKIDRTGETGRQKGKKQRRRILCRLTLKFASQSIKR
jgi:hypothetical protein